MPNSVLRKILEFTNLEKGQFYFLAKPGNPVHDRTVANHDVERSIGKPEGQSFK